MRRPMRVAFVVYLVLFWGLGLVRGLYDCLYTVRCWDSGMYLFSSSMIGIPRGDLYIGGCDAYYAHVCIIFCGGTDISWFELTTPNYFRHRCRLQYLPESHILRIGYLYPHEKRKENRIRKYSVGLKLCRMRLGT